MFKGKFLDIVSKEDGFLRGPFGSALKKSLFVEKTSETYKVYEQGVVLEQDHKVGSYYISKEYFDDKMSRFEARPGDFLVSCSGVNYGAIYRLPIDCERGVINQALLRIRLDNNIVDNDYFLYYFRAYIVKAITGGTGDSTIPNFPPMDYVKNIDIILPPLDEQRRIGRLLREIDLKIDNNKKIDEVLRSSIKTLFERWFLQFDFTDDNGKPFKTSGGAVRWDDSLNRWVPKDWDVIDLSEICDFNNGINYDKDEVGDTDYKIINVRNISSSAFLIDKYDLDTITLLSSKADRYLVEKDDILIARSGIPGAVRLLEGNAENVLFCGFIIRCKPKNPTMKYYITSTLKRLEGTNATKTGGSILQNVSQETLKKIKIVSPPLDVVERYNKMLNPMLAEMQKILEENQTLISLQNLLLPMLINGQVSMK